jgi:hypothetical protein
LLRFVGVSSRDHILCNNLTAETYPCTGSPGSSLCKRPRKGLFLDKNQHVHAKPNGLWRSTKLLTPLNLHRGHGQEVNVLKLGVLKSKAFGSGDGGGDGSYDGDVIPTREVRKALGKVVLN